MPPDEPRLVQADMPVVAKSAARHRAASVVVAAGAIGLVVVLGVFLRLSDPLSSPVVPAEDPYTHMALVREHLRTGELNPLNSDGAVYPPGLHAFLAAAWVYTGSDLYQLVLIGPVILGAIGILGVGILLWRTAGPVAGFVGALALAVAPEAIFRTTMMSPTALDLAILPFFLFALLRTLEGRLGWAGVAAPMSLFLALAHPWLLVILCAAGGVFVVLSLAMPAKASAQSAVTVTGLAACVALLGIGAGIAFLMPSFGGVLQSPTWISLPALGYGLIAAAAAIAATLAVLVRWGSVPSVIAPQRPLLVRFAMSAILAVAVFAAWTLASRQGMPSLVNLPRMFGWPVLLLAAAGFVALPFIASPMSNLAAALLATTAPFVLFNPLHSEFLPHRTSVFLGFAVALLAGITASAIVHATSAAVHARAPASSPKRHPSRAFLFAAPALLTATLLGGAVYAGTPDAYPGGWYRMYNPCELDALREVARQADADPAAILVTGDWEAKLVLAALTDDAQRVWFNGAIYTSEQARGDLVATMQHNHRPLILVVDRYLHTETPDADTHFLAGQPWQPAGSWCANMGIAQPRIEAFTDQAGAP